MGRPRKIIEVVDDRAWRQHAACRGLDPELFFPENAASSVIREVCAICPVRQECLEYAIVNNERQGIWGGTSERERRRMKRARRPA